MQVFAFKGNASAWGMALPESNCFSRKNIVSPKLRRIMKITGIILLTACLQVSAKSLSQTVNLSAKDAPFIEIIKSIERQTHYAFFYKVSWLTEAKKVTIKVANMPLREALDICFRDQPFSYVISGRNITIKPKDNLTEKQDASPPIDIKGRVVNENGDPAEAVTVTVKGTSVSVITNSNGEFLIKGIDNNATLVFTSVNMQPFELKIKGRTFLDVALQTKITAMQEVVINKGYYTETRRFSTGNVGKVSAKEIEQQPVQNPLLALQGRVPGITIVQNTGVPGGGVTVRIQGQNSVGGLNGSVGNDPLYVIDGVPIESQTLGTTIGGASASPILGRSGGANGSGAGNPLNYLNPSDIESMEVLKDADATAIFGSRAANGAILITTKKGKVGPIGVDVNLQQGWGKVGKMLDLLNTEEYIMMRKEAYRNDNISLPSIVANPNDGNFDINGLWEATRYTNWQKFLIGGTAKYSNGSLSLHGGTKSAQYLIGGTYNQTGNVFPGSFKDRKTSIHFSVNSETPNQKLRMQFSGNYVNDNNGLPASDLTSRIYLAPNAPNVYNDDGSLNWQPNPAGNSSWGNPMAAINYSYENKSTNLISNVLLSYQIFSGLTIQSTFGYNSFQTTEFIGQPRSFVAPEARINFSGQAFYTNNQSKSWIIEPLLTFKKKFRRSAFEALVGGSIQNRSNQGLYLNGSGFNSDLTLKDIRSAATVSVFNNIEQVYKYCAVYSRLNYVWNEKYILNLTARRDGSSRFGPKSRFHNFGSIGAGWIFTEEGFFQKHLPFINFGKLRGSYGITGNDQIGDYTYMNLYNTVFAGVPYQGMIGRLPGSLFDPYLEWEETKKMQVGIDLGVIKNKINLSVTYAQNTCSNQLLGYSLPQVTGFSSISTNFDATVENTAWEMTLNSTNFQNDKFSWTTSVNLTIPKNKLVSFPGLDKSTYASSLIIGQPLGTTKTYQFLGVNPLTGLYQLANGNGEPTSIVNFAKDAIVLINTQPKFYGGVQNNLRYKNFELTFLFQFTKRIGNDFFFQGGAPGRFLSGIGNQPDVVLDRWQTPGDMGAIQRFSQNNLNNSRAEANYTDVSFIKLRNASISYSIPSNKWSKKVPVKSFRLFAQGQNLITITKYNGFDPETQSNSSLPPLRMLTVGIQLSF